MGPVGVAHFDFRLELPSAVADEARPNGASSLWAGYVVGGRAVSNEEWGRQHKIKAFRKLKASVAPSLPLASFLSFQFSVFGFRFSLGSDRGSGLPADFGPLPHFKDTLMHFINLGYGYKTVATHQCVCVCVCEQECV